MNDLKFGSTAHKNFYFEMLGECRKQDSYHKAFFYVMGITEQTREHINLTFDFNSDSIISEGMHGAWITSSTTQICNLAFNLWSGYTDNKNAAAFTPYELFCCEHASLMMEGIKIKYPEYCKEITEVTPLTPDSFLTGEIIDTSRGSFHLTTMTKEQLNQAGYGYHHASDNDAYHIMGNGTRAFAIRNEDNPLFLVEL